MTELEQMLQQQPRDYNPEKPWELLYFDDEGVCQGSDEYRGYRAAERRAWRVLDIERNYTVLFFHRGVLVPEND